MIRPAFLSILVLAVIGLGAISTSAQGEKNLDGKVSATSLKSIDIRGKVGSIRLTPGSDMEIRYSVRLKAKTQWHLFGSSTGHPEQLEIREDRHGDVLTLDLSGDRNNIEEEWIVQVPANFAARLRLDVGKLRTSGIRGGLETKVDVGDIDIDVPEGTVTADSNVGDIRVRTTTPSYGNVDLRASVGKVRVTLDNHQVDHKRAPGAGDSWKLSGPGRDHIRAHSEVGDVDIRIR